MKQVNALQAAVGVIPAVPGFVPATALVRFVTDVVVLQAGLALAVVNIANMPKGVAVFQIELEHVSRVPIIVRNNMIRCVVVMVEPMVTLAWQHLPESRSIIEERV